jgi:cysteine synthase A
MAGRYESILETVGRTPVVRVAKLAPPHVRLYAKVEAFNPMGSVKDRLALGVIEDAERTGRLKPGQTVIEATSGNTGIGLAMVCARKGYPLVIVMGENFSVERRRLMRFLGARVILTPAHLRGSGMLAKATELAERHGWFLCRQFENEANAEMHSRTTAQEILADFAGEKLDHWVTGYGTGGTLKGVGRVLRERSPQTQIVLCEPDNAQVIGSGIPNPRNPDGTRAGGHPMSRPHPVQGWGPDFIPKLTEDAVAMRLIDRIIPVSGADALNLSRELARQEGIFVGISAGATLAGALEVCRTAPEGATVLCMLPDTGERYLSTPLFADIAADMSEEELEISRSTPGARFDAAAPAPSPAPAPAAGPASPDAPPPDAKAFVDEVLAASDRPVVLFALEWCEFCWAVRKLFARCGVPYRSVDIDSLRYQQDDMGAKIRAAVTARTSVTTIPQVFVGGEFVGGATDVLNAWKEGRFQRLLANHRVGYDTAAEVDALSFLPGWLHKR